MKAARLYEAGGPENLKIEDVPDPTPGPMQVVVKVAGVGICGHDQSDRQGLTRPHSGLPVTIGHEVAGTVVAVGEKVVGFAIGDRVATKQQTHCGQCDACRIGRETQCKERRFNYGGWAEYVALPSPGLLKVPDNIDLKLASVVACAVGTTLNALRNIGRVQPGENVLVTGAGGGLGLHGMQVAKALGGRAIALTSSPSKVEQLRAAGADDVVVAEGRDYWQAILDATGGRGPEVVLDNVGHPDVFSPIFRALPRHGRYVFTGQLYREKIDLYPAFLFGKEAAMLGAGPGSMSDFSDSLKLVSEGKVTPIIDPMPLSEAVEANRRLDAREIFGRGVLVP